MALARFAKGTIVQYETAPASAVWQAIGGLGTISGPSETVPRNDVTSHDTVGNRREFQAGLQDEATLDIEVTKYDPLDATHVQMHADLSTAGGVNRAFRILAPAPVSKYRQFSGFCSGFSPEFPIDRQMTARLSITITGDISVWT